MLLMVSVALPAFVSVTVRAADVDPVACDPKSMLVGLGLACGPDELIELFMSAWICVTERATL
jgi:hypothetical protein